MTTAFQFLIIGLTFVALLSFAGSSAASLLLVRWLDHDEVRKKSRLAPFWFIASPTTPIAYFHEEGHAIWKLRDILLKIFAISLGVCGVIAVIAVIADVPLETQK